MSANFDLFVKDFLNANTWPQRNNGVPLNLLDNLSPEELKIAEAELLKVVSLRDDFPIVGLGHIKSKAALPILYDLLDKSSQATKVKIANSIFQICQDDKMIDVVLMTMADITDHFEIIDALYYLLGFNDDRITKLLSSYQTHNNYLVTANAKRYMALKKQRQG